MRNPNQDLISVASLPMEEYIQSELKSGRHHEFINGQLIEKQMERPINIKVAGHLLNFIKAPLLSQGYEVFHNNAIVSSSDQTNYFYPDLFATKKSSGEGNSLIKFSPELVIEVIAPYTIITDRVDKYMAYTTITSLKYYLIVEPETTYATLFSKNVEGKWEAMTYIRNSDVIPMPLLDLNLPLSEVYK